MSPHLVRLAFLATCLGPLAAAAAERFVVDESKMGLCDSLVKRLNSGMSVARALQAPGVKTPRWSPGRMTFQTSPSSPKTTEAIEHATFDIDNDGRQEVLIKYITGFGGYGDLLWILRRPREEIDFSSVPDFSWDEYARLDAVESTTPWPYESRGLFLVQITPFSFGGVRYLSLKDTHFGEASFPDRTWVIAKYAGRRLGPGGFGHDTDDFETICSFKPRSK